jgi:FAD/FMN-containing dehydrogenase
MAQTRTRTLTSGAVLDESAVNAFETALRGDLIRPEDPTYDEARQVFNAMIDRHPALIARCVDAADVIASVNFARDTGLTVAVRGGGHNVAGLATCDGGLVIDLAPMRGVRVDPTRRTVRAAGGCTWGDVDHATHAFGLATPGGVVSTTGVGGLTLGGGIGHLTRPFGLSCDNLISADVVTADGRFVTASEQENANLLWGLRGGGGNFGIVTSFEFRLHPVSTVHAGPIFWPLEQMADAMRFYREFMATAPTELNVIFAILVVPPGPPFPEHLHNKTVCGTLCCYVGAPEQAEEAIRPLREFGPPAFALVGPMPHPVLQTLFDPVSPFGLQNYWKADFVEDLSDELITEHVRHAPGVPNIFSGVIIFPVSGAAQQVGKNETAYSHRDARYQHLVYAAYPDPADTPMNVAWVRDYWDALHPHSAGGAYVNFLSDEGQDRIRATYRDNYPRLVDLKKTYDPTNFFHVNQNIQPTA